MPLVLQRQGYKSCEFCVSCILEIVSWIYASGSQYNKIFNVSGILICPIFTEYIDRVFNISRVLNMRSESILETTLIFFKFKYPEETLKNKICSKCIWPETWILFLALSNIHFLPVFGKSLRNYALPTTPSSSLTIFPPISSTLFTLVRRPH